MKWKWRKKINALKGVFTEEFLQTLALQTDLSTKKKNTQELAASKYVEITMNEFSMETLKRGHSRIYEIILTSPFLLLALFFRIPLESTNKHAKRFCAALAQFCNIFTLEVI